MKTRGNKAFKMLDRYTGIPALLLLSLFKKKKKPPKNVNSIGILTVPAIGDIILMNGLLRDIKEFNPDIKIILFVKNELKEIAALMGSCDEIIPVEVYKPLQTIKTLRKHPVDVFIDASQWARLNAILTFFSVSKYKIGFKTKGQCKHLLFDFAATHSNQIHELYNYKQLSFSREIQSRNIPDLNLKAEIKTRPKMVVIHITPSGYLAGLKSWPFENWGEVINYLLKTGCEIYFTGSQSDFNNIELLLKDYSNNLNLHNAAGKYSMEDLAVLLKSAQVVLSVNTGIMHLASALNCNLIALHGPTNPERWGPLNTNSKIIKSNYPEAPCLNLGFEFNCTDRTGECMKRITPDLVISALKDFGL